MSVLATHTADGPLGRATHEVENQVPPLAGHNSFDENRPLAEALRREGAEWAEPRVSAFGSVTGSADAITLGYAANENPPALHTHDRTGRRIDEVAFHPSWHELMGISLGRELHAGPWRAPGAGAHVARAAMFMLMGQVEAGHGCPVSMTYAVVPALRTTPELAAQWEPRLTSLDYDPGLRPPAEKAGVLAGMAMTEKQGGSDVRANTTSAEALDGGEYRLTGHKWFCSAPMCDVFHVLAQADAGLSCFLLPRVLPDGTRNAFRLQRLKDKLGNRSNASSEVEFEGALAHLVGEEGRGVRTIIEMVNHTRLDCVLGSAAGMRQGVEQATHHAAHRSAFGRRLIDQPLMQNVLADLCVESEAATLTAMRLARAYDASGDDQEDRFRRIATAVSKYWICKRGPVHAAEALECLGGNGYVEASGLPRLYREMPLASVWEGSGNVNALDVLRALVRTPDTLEAFLDEVDLAAGAEPRLDRAVAELRAALAEDPSTLEVRARRIVERMAVCLQGSLLVRFGHPAVADAYAATRLAGDGGHALGTLPPAADMGAIIERHRPRA